ncbi:MAG TPA: serine hydrolase domain-containing protein [Gammaproteobacteria bacterium]|nr:serine hydrolase domain-containing protein [Gammaproteobacteria bacterium]
MPMRRALIAVCAIAALAGTAAARASGGCANEKDVVDPIVQPHVYAGGAATATQAVGMIVGVWLDGEPCYYGYGTTKLGEQSTPTARTLWEMGSNTKTFTATMLALHQLAGRIRVHDPVDFSEVPCVIAESTSVCYEPTGGMEALTYFELATFTGGLYDDPPNYKFAAAENYTQADFIKAFDVWPAPRNGLPAPNFYSNSSYGILGQVLMSFDGYTDFSDPDAFRANFAQWIGRAILRPLGMRCTNPDPDAMPQACNATARMASGYHLRGDHYEIESSPWPWVPWGPAGSLRSSAADMLRYLGAYLGNRIVAGRSVPWPLTATMTVARRLTAVPVDPLPAGAAFATPRQGYAWVVTPPRPGYDLRFSKDGETHDFSSCVVGVPKKNVGVVIIANIAMHPGAIPCHIATEIVEQTPPPN